MRGRIWPGLTSPKFHSKRQSNPSVQTLELMLN
jgi:hypothetical protein